jgi:hypothetical protein
MEETLFSAQIKRPLADRLRPQRWLKLSARTKWSAIMRRWDE